MKQLAPLGLLALGLLHCSASVDVVTADDAGKDVSLDQAADAKDSGPDVLAHDAGADARDAATPVQGACAQGKIQVGEFATWSGKVNVHHVTQGAWEVDSDCSSGALDNDLAYCQKFWPAATDLVAVTVSSDLKPFASADGTAPTCGGVASAVGKEQFACCTP